MTHEAEIEADLTRGLSIREALMNRAVADLGPFVFYSTGEVTYRRTGAVVWRPGDSPSSRPVPKHRGYSDKPHTKRRF